MVTVTNVILKNFYLSTCNAEVLNFTSQFTRQSSFGESITFSIAVTKIDTKYTEMLALATS